MIPLHVMYYSYAGTGGGLTPLVAELLKGGELEVKRISLLLPRFTTEPLQFGRRF